MRLRAEAGLEAKDARDPFKDIDLTTLSVVDRNTVDKLRRACRDEGKEGLVRALAGLAKTNSQLFMWLLKQIID
jgi:hypothetical protein